MKFPSRCSSIHSPSPPISRLVKHGKQHHELHIVPGPLLGLPIPAVRLYSGRCCTAVQCTHAGHRSHSVWARASLRQHRHRRANCKILLYKLKKYFLHLQHGWTGASGLVLDLGYMCQAIVSMQVKCHWILSSVWNPNTYATTEQRMWFITPVQCITAAFNNIFDSRQGDNR